MDLIKTTFSASFGAGVVQEYPERVFFSYVPAAFRALGVLHRRALVPSNYTGVKVMQEDDENLAALERALSSYGGIAALAF